MGIYQVEYCLGGNCIRRNFLDWNNPGGNFLGGNYPGLGENLLSGWELSWVVIFWMGIVWVGIFRVGILWVGIFRVGVILGGSFPRWEFSGWELSVGNHPGGNFPGGSFHITKSLKGFISLIRSCSENLCEFFTNVVVHTNILWFLLSSNKSLPFYKTSSFGVCIESSIFFKLFITFVRFTL